MLQAACYLRRAASGSSSSSIRTPFFAASSRALASSMPASSSENLDTGDRHQRPPVGPLRRAVSASKLIAANVYISEGRNKEVIDRLVAVLGGWRGRGRGSGEADVNSFDFASSSPSAPASSPSPSSSSPASAAALVHVFVDEPYNRTGFTIAGLSSSSSSEEEEEEENAGGGEAAAAAAAARDGADGSSSPSPSLSSVPAAIALLSREALRLVDWRAAEGTHPAIGVVDHVAVHALFPGPRRLFASSGENPEGCGGGSGEREARAAARRIAKSLGKLGVPTYLYGSASVDNASSGDASNASQWRKLAEVRRALGYFSSGPSSSSSSSTAAAAAAAATAPSNSFARFPDPLPSPDAGPARAEASKGAAAVGSVDWVMNVNVPLVIEGGGEGKEGGADDASSSSLASTATAAAVARAVSARRGTPVSAGGFALPGVEALALVHAPGVVEVACNLTDGSVDPRDVASAVERAARAAGLSVRKKKSKAENNDDDEDVGESDSSWYVTGKRPEEVAAEAAAALGLEIVK